MCDIKSVLFDIYGTLINIRTNEHKEEVFDAVSRFLGYRRVFLSGRELKELYFSELNQQFAQSRERHPEVDVILAFERVLRGYGWTGDRYLALITSQLYRSLTRERLTLYDDTFWTLNEFRKRFRLGIVTDAQRAFCKPELRALRIEEFFDTIVISSDYGFRKPDPRLFHIALAAMNAKGAETAYIGNSWETDLLGAKGAGLAVAGLIHQSEDEVKAYPEETKPSFVARNLTEAFDIIAKMPLPDTEVSSGKDRQPILRQK